MANPLPYYRILRDEYPVYYMPQWDTFALSRFDDIWRVLEVNDGTFVASEGTLPAAAVLAEHNTGPVDDPPLHPLPFHAVFDTDLYGEIRRAHSQPLRPRSVAGLGARIRALANERLDLLLPRGSFDLTQDYGGIVVASMVCELLGLPTELAPQVLAAVNAGSLAEPGVGVDTAEARPNYLEFSDSGGRSAAAPSSPGTRLPVVDGLLGYRLPDGSALDRRRSRDPDALHLHRWHGNGAQDRRPRPVGAQPAARPVGSGARRPRHQRAARARGDDPVLRPRAVVRPNGAKALHHSRRDDSSPASASSPCWRRRTATSGNTRSPTSSSGTDPSVARWRSAAASTSASATTWPGWKSLCCCRNGCGGCRTIAIQSDAATRLPSSFQWGWNKIPVEV